ncbi:MAG: RHS repeat-associated core domain-containing protein [Phycisphaerae bacterium]
MVESYSYDVFGKATIRDSGGVTRATSAFGNSRLFTGREYDNEMSMGLYYYRARFYKPSLGRFLQTDPIKYRSGLNLYTYCGNNPLNWLDPWGLEKDKDKDEGKDKDGEEGEDGTEGPKPPEPPIPPDPEPEPPTPEEGKKPSLDDPLGRGDEPLTIPESCIVGGLGLAFVGGMAICAAPAPVVVAGGLIAVAAGGLLAATGGVLALCGL